MLVQAKASLPEGFNEKALEGLDPLAQVEFISRFTAAMPKPAEKTPATRQLGAQVPAKASIPEDEPPAASMAERARVTKELLAENRKKGGKGIIVGMYK